MGEPNQQPVRTHRGDHIAELRLNRKDKLNALDEHMLEAIETALAGWLPNPPRVLLLGAEGRGFVAGADIEQMATMSPEQASAFAALGHRVMAQLEAFPSPVIAVVEGVALGGGLELALCCDWIVAGERARFGLPEVKLGVIPGFGGTQRLSSRLGLARAKQWVFSGEIFGAQDAHAAGLVNQVVAAGEAHQAALTLATVIARRGPRAVAAAKRVMQLALQGDPAVVLEAERREFSACFEESGEQREGMAAFLENRSPSFSS